MKCSNIHNTNVKAYPKRIPYDFCLIFYVQMEDTITFMCGMHTSVASLLSFLAYWCANCSASVWLYFVILLSSTAEKCLISNGGNDSIHLFTCQIVWSSCLHTSIKMEWCRMLEYNCYFLLGNLKYCWWCSQLFDV